MPVVNQYDIVIDALRDFDDIERYGEVPSNMQNQQEIPVSDPRAATHCPAATADAEPPDDPPGTRSVSHGFRVSWAKKAGAQRLCRLFRDSH